MTVIYAKDFIDLDDVLFNCGGGVAQLVGNLIGGRVALELLNDFFLSGS